MSEHHCASLRVSLYLMLGEPGLEGSHHGVVHLLPQQVKHVDIAALRRLDKDPHGIRAKLSLSILNADSH